MTYSIIGILATLILLIINRDVIWSREKKRSAEDYRYFLYGVLSYYVTDMLWGILEANHLTAILYADTAIHFIAMASAVALWTRYVVSYLNNGNRFERFLYHAGNLFLLFEVAVVVGNFFCPLLFHFDGEGAYHADPARYVTLAIQILLFLLTSIYTLQTTRKTRGSDRLRHRTIGMFGLAMTIFIAIQVFYPLLPFYAMGYMLGTCVLHSFVVEDEKEEYRKELEENKEALKDALAAAENASKAKTAFLSNMSHEIRTPMNAIIGLNNIAMNEESASDKIKEYLQKISDSANHLLSIINDILDMSRIESGRMQIRSEEFSFSKEIEQVNTIIASQCRDKGLLYDCEIIGHIDEYYVGDAVKLKQILINTLGNAVKFTPEGGKVTLLIEEGIEYEDKKTLKFTVKDTGIGMSKDYLPHIFEAFSQEDSSSTSRYGSTGLGMPITRSIVELMNGHMEVESEKGKGTSFYITVTFTRSDRNKESIEIKDLDPNGMHVLVIDDDPIALEHARIILKEIGIHCETAQSGKEGIDMARIRHGRREDYDLILVDWKMPELDGIETTKEIRNFAKEDMPIIILTSYNWEDIETDAKRAGVDSFVAKPLFAGSVLDEFAEAYAKKNEHPVRKKKELKDKRILLAEDIQINAEIIASLLSMKEMKVEHAENGRVAVEMFETHEEGYYDAILMDMRMPEMDGLEASKKIRSMDRKDAKEIPIIALTANAFDEDVQRSMQAGLNAHLSKPVEPEQLFTTLQTLIKEKTEE